MRKLGIRSIARQPNPYRLSQRRFGALQRFPNLLQQDFRAQRPNHKWGSDITYVRTQQGFVYLAVIKDFYDAAIIGYALSRSPSVYLVSQALRMAVTNQSLQGLVLHSDQGHQYQSAAYQTLLTRYGITPSMSRKGNVLDNAPTENFFSHLKEELLRHVQPQDFHEAQLLVQDYIHFYNHERIQLKTKLTPMELRRQFA